MQAGWKAYLAELIGTFALVWLASTTMAVYAERAPGDASAGAVVNALAYGLALVVLIYAIGPISGCHINPAVTIGLWSAGKIPLNEGIAYIVAQLFGGILAGIVHAALLGVGASSAGLTLPGPDIGDGHVAIIEAILSFVFVFTLMGSAVGGKQPTGWSRLAPGMALALAVLVAGPLTGASLNPARTLGPAVVSANWTVHWAYWIGPIAGSLLAANLYQLVSPGERAADRGAR
ncbi:MAG: aquaporin [Chloroflexi bacterium]|nr:aquaporin [Chloroflexota bacterium]